MGSIRSSREPTVAPTPAHRSGVGSALTDPVVRQAILLTSLMLSLGFILVFFFLRYAWRRLYRRRRCSDSSGPIETAEGETTALLLGGAAAEYGAQSGHQLTEAVAPLRPEARRSEPHTTVHAKPDTSSGVVVVPVWGESGQGFFRATSGSAAPTPARCTPPRGCDGGDGESVTPHPPTPPQLQRESAPRLSYRSARDESGKASGVKEFSSQSLSRSSALLAASTPDSVECHRATSATPPSTERGPCLYPLTSVALDEHDAREYVVSTEALARTQLSLAYERGRLADATRQRDAVARDVAALNAYRDTFESDVMPMIFNDLQSAAEELADSETAMLTSVDRRQKVLRVVEAESVAQESALLSRISALVSQVNQSQSRGSRPASSAGSPRPNALSLPPTPPPPDALK